VARASASNVRNAYVACRAEHAYPLDGEGFREAVPLAGDDGLLARLANIASGP
jgi:hypothetical protein